MTKACPTCEGSGLGPCLTCHGGGCSVCLTLSDPDEYERCPTCDGKGVVALTAVELEQMGQIPMFDPLPSRAHPKGEVKP